MTIRNITMRFVFRVPYEAELIRFEREAKRIKDLSVKEPVDKIAVVQTWLMEIDGDGK